MEDGKWKMEKRDSPQIGTGAVISLPALTSMWVGLRRDDAVAARRYCSTAARGTQKQRRQRN
jgi:hypothetical protein